MPRMKVATFRRPRTGKTYKSVRVKTKARVK